MKKSILIAVLTASMATSAFAQWKPAGDKIKTKWAEQVNPENVLPEYPRPVMERESGKTSMVCGIMPSQKREPFLRLMKDRSWFLLP